ncbi:acetyl-CoA carboxylase biotin carboxyl carrier protein [Psychrobacter aestuarii]|uniref:Lipoyl-binding domain-containing protein n=1 Tax=Psychrobacter aestuarii TaxID=556327 RepID=A0ABN0VR23_9GAMM|nr:biotin/lipoyl-containing protein [Psychrobacter aestuarii]
MDIEQIKRVIEMVERSQLHEVSVTDGAQSIKVTNKTAAGATAPAGKQKAAQPQASDSGDDAVKTVSATHVGMLYLSKDGATDALVTVGAAIEKGQTVCYIEELTRLLPVVSEHDGIVSAILAEHGQGVEYGQEIFEVEGGRCS